VSRPYKNIFFWVVLQHRYLFKTILVKCPVKSGPRVGSFSIACSRPSRPLELSTR